MSFYLTNETGDRRTRCITRSLDLNLCGKFLKTNYNVHKSYSEWIYYARTIMVDTNFKPIWSGIHKKFLSAEASLNDVENAENTFNFVDVYVLKNLHDLRLL